MLKNSLNMYTVMYTVLIKSLSDKYNYLPSNCFEIYRYTQALIKLDPSISIAPIFAPTIPQLAHHIWPNMIDSDWPKPKFSEKKHLGFECSILPSKHVDFVCPLFKDSFLKSNHFPQFLQLCGPEESLTVGLLQLLGWSNMSLRSLNFPCLYNSGV